MATFDSENSFSDDSPDHLINKINNYRINTCIPKSLYDFQSVEYSFNIKLLNKSPSNNDSKPGNTNENLNNKSTPTKRIHNSQPGDPVVEIMLPKQIPQISSGTEKRGGNPISDPQRTSSLTPVQLFKYSRLKRNINNFSTPSGPTRTIFTCPISPIGLKFRLFNSSDKKSPLNNSPDNVSGPIQKIHQDDKTGYCGFRSQRRSGLIQKTITKSKFMSLVSVTSRKECDTSHETTTFEGTRAMSISNVETRPSNFELSDESTSSDSNEIPNINNETSFYLSRIQTNIYKQSNIENLWKGSASHSDDSSGNFTGRVDIQQNLINQQNDAKVFNISIEQDEIIFTEEVPPDINKQSNAKLPQDSDSSSEDSSKNSTVGGDSQLNHINKGNDSQFTDISIEQQHIATTEDTDSNKQSNSDLPQRSKSFSEDSDGNHITPIDIQQNHINKNDDPNLANISTKQEAITVEERPFNCNTDHYSLSMESESIKDELNILDLSISEFELSLSDSEQEEISQIDITDKNKQATVSNELIQQYQISVNEEMKSVSQPSFNGTVGVNKLTEESDIQIINRITSETNINENYQNDLSVNHHVPEAIVNSNTTTLLTSEQNSTSYITLVDQSAGLRNCAYNELKLTMNTSEQRKASTNSSNVINNDYSTVIPILSLNKIVTDTSNNKSLSDLTKEVTTIDINNKTSRWSNEAKSDIIQISSKSMLNCNLEQSEHNSTKICTKATRQSKRIKQRACHKTNSVISTKTNQKAFKAKTNTLKVNNQTSKIIQQNSLSSQNNLIANPINNSQSSSTETPESAVNIEDKNTLGLEVPEARLNINSEPKFSSDQNSVIKTRSKRKASKLKQVAKRNLGGIEKPRNNSAELSNNKCITTPRGSMLNVKCCNLEQSERNLTTICINPTRQSKRIKQRAWRKSSSVISTKSNQKAFKAKTNTLKVNDQTSKIFEQNSLSSPNNLMPAPNNNSQSSSIQTPESAVNIEVENKPELKAPEARSNINSEELKINNDRNSIIKTRSKRKASKVKIVAKRSLEAIVKTVMQTNSAELSPNNLMPAPNNNSQSSSIQTLETAVNIEVENKPELNAPEARSNINLEELKINSDRNSVIKTRSKRKASKVKIVAKRNSNSAVLSTNKCITTPRRSSRSPKPISAYWLNGPRHVRPVIRDVKQLAKNYDPRIPNILLPPEVKTAMQTNSAELSPNNLMPAPNNNSQSSSIQTPESAVNIEDENKPELKAPEARSNINSEELKINNDRNSIIKTRSKRKGSKVKIVAKRSLEAILKTVMQTNSAELSPNNLMPAPNNNSQSSSIQTLETAVNIEVENKPELNAPEARSNINLEELKINSDRNSVIKTRSKRKASKVKIVAKRNSNSAVLSTNKCITTPRRSSRSPKPISAYWLNGPRRVRPVIRDVKQLAKNYDPRIPIILLPSEPLSYKALSELLRQISNRMP